MRNAAALTGISLTLGGCALGVPQNELSVEEVVTDLERLNGSEITVIGWMGEECLGLDCRVFRSSADARVLETWDHDKYEIDDRWIDAFDHSINLCTDGWDQTRISLFMQGERVAVTGKLDADCKINGGCLDGCDFQLESIARTGI